MSSSVAPSGKCGHGQLRRRPGPAKRPCRVSVALVAGIATAFSLGAQPIGGAAASAQLLAASNPAAASSGCPTAISVDLGAGQQCVGWRVSMFLQSESSNGVCDDALFMLVPLSEHADEYLALWNRTGPNADPSPSAPWAFTSATGGLGGEQAWSTTALTPRTPASACTSTSRKATAPGSSRPAAGGATCCRAQVISRASLEPGR